MKKAFINFALITVTSLVAIGLLEVGLRIYYRVARGAEFNTATLIAEGRIDPLHGLGQHHDCDWLRSLYPHPNLGFVQHNLGNCGKITLNELSVHGRVMPEVGKAYVVLMLGGSVAAQLVSGFASLEVNYLEAELNKRFVSPNGLPFAVINGANGSWKQPNQIIRMTEQMNQVDAFVSLEGFNEIHAITLGKKIESVGMPFYTTSQLPDVSRDGLLRVFTFREIMHRHKWLQESYLILTVFFKVRNIVGTHFTNAVQASHLAKLYEYPGNKDIGERINQGFTQYYSYLDSMDALAYGHRKNFSFFIQPIPSLYKPLHKDDWPDRALFQSENYLRLESDVLKRKFKALKAHSTLKVFQNVPEWIYADSAHPWINAETGESRGYQLLAEFMAERIGTDWKLKKR